MKDPYYGRPEMSNSDLSWLRNQIESPSFRGDSAKAYRFGTLIDCMITEKDKVNYFNRTCAGEIYSAEEFKVAEEMKKSFYKDQQCKWMADNAIFQKIDVRPMEIAYLGVNWIQDCRIKWDLGLPPEYPSGDIKSTTATTQRQFEEAAEYFQYFRQRAFYMDVGKTDIDLLIGISKKNYKIFKIPIFRNDKLYSLGKQQYSELAFQWHYLFNNF